MNVSYDLYPNCMKLTFLFKKYYIVSHLLGSDLECLKYLWTLGIIFPMNSTTFVMVSSRLTYLIILWDYSIIVYV